MKILANEDLFNRADNADLGSGWDAGYATFANWQIKSNGVQTTSVGNDSFESNNQVTLPNDQWTQALLSLWTGAGYRNAHVLGRMPAPTTASAYCATVDLSPGAYICKYIGASFFVLSTNATYTPAANITMRLECVGTTMTNYIDDVSKTSAVDSDLASGRAGLASYFEGSIGDVGFDTFRCGRFGIRDAAVMRGVGRGIYVGGR